MVGVGVGVGGGVGGGVGVGVGEVGGWRWLQLVTFNCLSFSIIIVIRKLQTKQ